MKYIFLVNPTAGDGKFVESLELKIKSVFSNGGYEYEIYETTGKDKAKRFMKDRCLRGEELVFVSCGGDGTIHNIINSIVGYENASLAVMPFGSGNDFIRNFSDIESYLDLNNLINGRKEKIDLMKVNEEYVASVGNVGFDADVAFNMTKFKKIKVLTGRGRYNVSLFYSMMHKLGKNLKYYFDDGTVLSENLTLGVVANGQTYGSGYMCAPYASVDDGILDICLMKIMTRRTMIRLIDIYKHGNHLDDERMRKYVIYKKSKTVKLESKTDINLCVDGELMCGKVFNFKCEHDAINFIIPLSSKIVHGRENFRELVH